MNNAEPSIESKPGVGKPALKPYYTIKDAAVLMGITKDCLKSRVRRGQVATVFFGGRRVITLESLMTITQTKGGDE